MKIFTVDAFTDKLFSGNPAGVCILDEDMSENTMLSIAAEMNLSETAFVKKIDEGFSLKWFTPKVEVQLCGHATLATAHILWEQGILSQNDEARFHTLSGLLTVTNDNGEYEMNFPAYTVKDVSPSEKLIEALNVTPINFAEAEYHYICELESEEQLRNVFPSMESFMGLEKFGTIITAKSNSNDYDFVSRFFAPSKGVNEDPVTGSAHCSLGPYWMQKTGRDYFTAYQASQRGGVVKIKMNDGRVLLKGRAVTFLRGDISL
ncbi:MAG: PhzF family phenazine biosynthesis protein [Ignavibacteriae bacterium]|nr:PhzF family phenazine biosynthesis protein [Ignavibacteriota bacterium]